MRECRTPLLIAFIGTRVRKPKPSLRSLVPVRQVDSRGRKTALDGMDPRSAPTSSRRSRSGPDSRQRQPAGVLIPLEVSHGARYREEYRRRRSSSVPPSGSPAYTGVYQAHQRTAPQVLLVLQPLPPVLKATPGLRPGCGKEHKKSVSFSSTATVYV